MISAYVLMTTLPPRHFAGGTREHPAQPVHHSVSNQAPLERQSHASQPFQQVWTITQSTQHKDASKQHVVTDKRLHMFTLFCQLRYSTCAGLPQCHSRLNDQNVIREFVFQKTRRNGLVVYELDSDVMEPKKIYFVGRKLVLFLVHAGGYQGRRQGYWHLLLLRRHVALQKRTTFYVRSLLFGGHSLESPLVSKYQYLPPRSSCTTLDNDYYIELHLVRIT